jgi:FixJ family two-component response regulator
MEHNATVAIVDDDGCFRESLARLLKSAGYTVAQFRSAEEFLSDVSQCDCALVDLRMPSLSGLDLQKRLKQIFPHLGVVFLSGQGAIPDSVEAIRNGALDFLEKTVREGPLFAAIEKAVLHTRAGRSVKEENDEQQLKFQRLTNREREVFMLVAAGILNKQIAFKLGTSERTIKAHRRRVMDKLGAGSLAHLVRLASQLDVPVLNKEEYDDITGHRFASGNR